MHHSVLFALHHQHRHRFRPARWQALAARQKLQILLQPLAPQARQTLQQDLELLARCQSLPTGWPEAVPVLVVQGEQDAVVHAASAQQLIDDLGAQPLTLHRDPNWGHALITPTVLSVVQQWLGAL